MIRLALFTAILALCACSPAANDTAAVPSSPAAGAPPVGPAPAPDGPYAATPKPGEELPPSQTTPGPIPLEFRHVWAIEPADCTKAPGLTRIAIAPGAVRFYEGRAVVVTAEAPHPKAMTMEVDHTAEGQTSRETHTLAIDDAGKLTYKRRDSTFTYTRCD